MFLHAFSVLCMLSDLPVHQGIVRSLKKQPSSRWPSVRFDYTLTAGVCTVPSCMFKDSSSGCRTKHILHDQHCGLRSISGARESLGLGVMQETWGCLQTMP